MKNGGQGRRFIKKEKYIYINIYKEFIIPFKFETKIQHRQFSSKTRFFAFTPTKNTYKNPISKKEKKKKCQFGKYQSYKKPYKYMYIKIYNYLFDVWTVLAICVPLYIERA